MAFDECTPYPCEYSYAKDSMDMTHRWLRRCCDHFDSTSERYGYKQSLFPIVQGSVYPELRKQSAEKIGPMNQKEYITAAILIGLIALWITSSDIFGMGGPVIMALVALNIFRVLRWRDIARIQWEVVALYASACALGKGLAVTGAALFLADSFVNILPEFLKSGEGLAEDRRCRNSGKPSAGGCPAGSGPYP